MKLRAAIEPPLLPHAITSESQFPMTTSGDFPLTCFCKHATHEHLSAFKALGNANNDWDVSLNLIKLSGSVAPDKIPSREEVVRVFEELCVHRRHNTVQHQIQELT